MAETAHTTHPEPAHGSAAQRREVAARLRSIAGHLRGVDRMVAEDAYCIDVLTQVSAATKALQSLALLLMDDHLAHCVADAAAEGGKVANAKIAEASAAIARLVKS